MYFYFVERHIEQETNKSNGYIKYFLCGYVRDIYEINKCIAEI